MKRTITWQDAMPSEGKSGTLSKSKANQLKKARGGKKCHKMWKNVSWEPGVLS